MGLINNTTSQEQPEEAISPVKEVPEEKPDRSWVVPTVVVILLLALLAGLVGGGYWVFVHKDELKEKFFPQEPVSTVSEPTEFTEPISESTEIIEVVEEAPKEKSPSFFRKIIKKDRTITVRGTLIGKEGGSAALINEKMVPEGYLINGIRILQITDKSVVIQSDTLKYRLQVGESFNPDER